MNWLRCEVKPLKHNIILYTLFSYKNKLYKNVEARISKPLKHVKNMAEAKSFWNTF